MDLSFLTRAKEFFDFGEAQAAANLPFSVQNILTQTGVEALTPMIAALWRDIDPAWEVALCDLSNHGYDMDVDQKILSVDSKGLRADSALASPYFGPQILLSMIEGLRMVRHVEWLDHALERYHPESIIKIGRICVADSVTQTIHAAWFAREMGYEALWKHMLCGAHSDMTQCFDRVMERCLTQGVAESDAMAEALSLTFRTWFTDEDRVRACDHDSLNVMDDLMDNDATIGLKQIDGAAVTCLSLYVGGEATYLSSDLVRDMITNPFYGAVDDSINNAHLMQIIRDNKVSEVAGIPFRDAGLAQRFIVID